jgi:hypothetical protein
VTTTLKPQAHQAQIPAHLPKRLDIRGIEVKNPGASPEAFKNMISRHEEKPKQASEYQTQWK